MLGKISADEIRKYFSYFFQKIDFNIYSNCLRQFTGNPKNYYLEKKNKKKHESIINLSSAVIA